MAEVNYDMMSNSELKIKLTEMENEYPMVVAYSRIALADVKLG